MTFKLPQEGKSGYQGISESEQMHPSTIYSNPYFLYSFFKTDLDCLVYSLQFIVLNLSSHQAKTGLPATATQRFA